MYTIYASEPLRPSEQSEASPFVKIFSFFFCFFFLFLFFFFFFFKPLEKKRFETSSQPSTSAQHAVTVVVRLRELAQRRFWRFWRRCRWPEREAVHGEGAGRHRVAAQQVHGGLLYVVRQPQLARRAPAGESTSCVCKRSSAAPLSPHLPWPSGCYIYIFSF